MIFARRYLTLVLGLIAVVAAGSLLYRNVVFENRPGENDYRLGNRYLQKGRVEVALAAFDRSLEQDKLYAPSHMARGLALMHMERFDDALVSLNRAVSLDAKLAHALANRGILHDRLGRHDLALSDYRKALALEPELGQGPGLLWRFLHNAQEKPATLVDRANYIEQEMQKPEADRELRMPEADEEQRMYAR